MQIITTAIFYDEEAKKEIETEYIFDLHDISNANRSEDNYTVITDRSSGIRTNVNIKFDTYKEIILKEFLKVKEIKE